MIVNSDWKQPAPGADILHCTVYLHALYLEWSMTGYDLYSRQVKTVQDADTAVSDDSCP